MASKTAHHLTLVWLCLWGSQLPNDREKQAQEGQGYCSQEGTVCRLLAGSVKAYTG